MISTGAAQAGYAWWSTGGGDTGFSASTTLTLPRRTATAPHPDTLASRQRSTRTAPQRVTSAEPQRPRASAPHQSARAAWCWKRPWIDHSHSRTQNQRGRRALPATNAAEPIAPVSWPLIDKTDSAKYNWGAQGLLVGRGAPLHDGVAPGPRGTCASTTPSRALDLVMAASTAGPAPRTPLLLSHFTRSDHRGASLPARPTDLNTSRSACDTTAPCTRRRAHGETDSRSRVHTREPPTLATPTHTLDSRTRHGTHHDMFNLTNSP